jgi:hypothetical protein
MPTVGKMVRPTLVRVERTCPSAEVKDVVAEGGKFGGMDVEKST